jgi:hypothetical protein
MAKTRFRHPRLLWLTPVLVAIVFASLIAGLNPARVAAVDVV